MTDNEIIALWFSDLTLDVPELARLAGKPEDLVRELVDPRTEWDADHALAFGYRWLN